MNVVINETRGKMSLRAMRFKHLLIREVMSLRNRYLVYHPEGAAKIPELTADANSPRNMANLVQGMQFFYGTAPLPRPAENLLDPNVPQITTVTKQLLAHRTIKYQIHQKVGVYSEQSPVSSAPANPHPRQLPHWRSAH
jgi:hypothetical protein